MARTRDANFDQYIREIRETPLLTAEQEVELARRVQNGDKQAREQMIHANLRLVVAVAKDFLNRGLPFEDLIAEGNIGLMKAIEKFDPEQGNRFSTYGVHWIKQSIRRALANTGKTIRIPGYMIEIISQFRQKSAEMASKDGGRPQDTRKVAKAMGLTDDQLAMMRAALAANATTSELHHNDNETRLNETLPDSRSLDPAEQVINLQETAMLMTLLESISDREATVLRLRYGMGDEDPLTLSDIGARMGLTRERIRQIENGALRKLHGFLSGQRAYQDGP
jgi:RNA polymerase primary sigma factor